MKYFILGIICSIVISIASIVIFYNFWPIGGIDLLQPEEFLGSTITTINATDTIKDSRAVINTNFTNLNDGKIENSTTTLPLLTTLTGLTTANSITLSSTKLGVASTTPWGVLSVEQGTETYSFVVSNTGSSTPSLIVNGVNGNGRVGIATSSPSAMFGIGSGSATTTVDLGKVCYRIQTDGGSTIYTWWTLNGGGPVLASSTTSCF